jgi:hypothetical protein
MTKHSIIIDPEFRALVPTMAADSLSWGDSMNNHPLVWHYTLGIYVHRIIADGQIKLSTGSDGKHRPITWFSQNQEYEYSTLRNLTENGVRRPLDKNETEERGNGLYRIGVSQIETELKPWMRLRRIARLSKRSIYLLETKGRDVGANPFEWWGTLLPVPSKYWKQIEHFKNGSWEEMAS